MKKTKLVMAALAAILAISGVNAGSLKEIEDRVSDDVKKVEKLKAEIAEIEKNPDYKEFINASKSLQTCSAYEDALYLEKVCTTENPCDTKNTKIEKACDNTFGKTNLNNDKALIKFVVTSVNSKCEITDEDIDIKAGRNAGDFVRCKADNKVYKFNKLNATAAKNGKDGQAAALCLVLGGKPGGKEKSSSGRKWLSCAGIDESKCKEADMNNSYGVRDLLRYTFWDSSEDKCDISLN